MELVNRTQKLSLSFLNLDNDRYGPKENFAKICQIKWNGIRSVKFEIVQIDFYDFISLLSSKNFATMAMWRKDSSSLLVMILYN